MLELRSHPGSWMKRVVTCGTHMQECRKAWKKNVVANRILSILGMSRKWEPLANPGISLLLLTGKPVKKYFNFYCSLKLPFTCISNIKKQLKRHSCTRIRGILKFFQNIFTFCFSFSLSLALSFRGIHFLLRFGFIKFVKDWKPLAAFLSDGILSLAIPFCLILIPMIFLSFLSIGCTTFEEHREWQHVFLSV